VLIALIPARSGSKRVPGKNIRELAGHPLLAYTIQVAKDSGLFGEHIYVSSDSDEYLGIAERYGAKGIKRPRSLALDTSPDSKWIEHALKNKAGVDYYFILRPTSPFRSHKTLEKSLDTIKGHDGYILKGVERVKQHPEKMWVWVKGKMIPYGEMDNDNHLLPTNCLEKLYVQNASIEIRIPESAYVYIQDGYRVEWNKEKIHVPYITDGYEGFDINTEDDWILAEALIERGLAKLPEIKP
jgi:N-acylneuraminate cytidylyltransferase